MLSEQLGPEWRGPFNADQLLEQPKGSLGLRASTSLTFRTSKTRVQVADGQPRLADGTPLTLASEEQRHEFLRRRRRENQETDFVYPRVTYTLSPSDLWPPDVATTP